MKLEIHKENMQVFVVFKELVGVDAVIGNNIGNNINNIGNNINNNNNVMVR